MTSFKNKHVLTSLFILALVPRIVAIWIVGDRAFENEFGVLVQNMLNGNGYSYYSVSSEGKIAPEYSDAAIYHIPSAYMPPGYPFFLTCITFFTGDNNSAPYFVEIIQALLAAITSVLLYKIVAIKFNAKIAFFSALLFCFYPILVFSASQITAVTLYLFFNILTVFSLIKGEQTEHTCWYYTAGLAFGLLILSRGQVLLYFPFIAVWIFAVSKKKRFKKAIVFIGITVLVLAPWGIRNFYQFGKLTSLTLSGGISLWQGQNENATGTRSEYTNPSVEISDNLRNQIISLKPTKDYEFILDKIYFKEALSFMKRYPLSVIRLSFKKLTFYWGYYWGINCIYPGAKSPLYWLPWFLILPFFVIGIIISLKDFKRLSIFYIYFSLSTLIVMVFFVIPRYRLFILPLIFPFAFNGLSNIIYKLRAWF